MSNTRTRFMRCGTRTIGLPERLDTEENRALIARVGSLEGGEYTILSPEDTERLAKIFNQHDLWNLF